MSRFTCFMVEPVPLRRTWLRRYSRDHNCCPPGNTHSYHNAMTPIGDLVVPLPGPDGIEHIERRAEDYTCDLRWPLTCERCSYDFIVDDHRQLFDLRLFRRVADGVIIGHTHDSIEGRVPVGAMWFGDWAFDEKYKGPDGRALHVMTPAGSWAIDGPATDGGKWSRSGTPPLVTAMPSIHFVGRYHGWLRDGELIEC